MQIHNNFSPVQLGHGGKPDHAGNGNGHKFDVAAADTEPATTTDTDNAVAPTEETAEHQRPGNSVAHRARMHLASIDGVDIKNFGQLVSMIARNMFEAPTDETDGAGVVADATGIVDETTEAGETEASGDETPSSDDQADTTTPPASEGEDPVVDLVDTLVEQTTEETTDPAVTLLDELLGEGDDETEVT